MRKNVSKGALNVQCTANKRGNLTCKHVVKIFGIFESWRFYKRLRMRKSVYMGVNLSFLYKRIHTHMQIKQEKYEHPEQPNKEPVVVE